MNLLLTRPKAQADAMAEALRSRGHRVLLAPLLRVDRLQFDDRILRSASAIIVTSANAVPALESLDPAVRIFAVGPDTASVATAAGFSNVMAATGTASSLLDLVKHQWQPEDGTLAYASGHHVSVDVAGALALQGYSCKRVEVYATSQALQLSEETAGLLRRGEIDAVLFMSVRTADAFRGLVASTGNPEVCRRARFAVGQDRRSAGASAVDRVPHGRLADKGRNPSRGRRAGGRSRRRSIPAFIR